MFNLNKKIVGLSFVSFSALAVSLFSGQSGLCQSLDVKNPTPLQPGINSATIDSFGKEQFWTFMAQPGHFSLVFAISGPQEGFSVGARADVAAVFAPASPGSSLTAKKTASGTIFDGNVKQPTKVVVMIEPAKSPLVRQTNDYTLQMTGSTGAVQGAGVAVGAAAAALSAAGASSGGGANAAAPSVVGVYNVFTNNYGAAKFKADGTVATTSGASGTWEVFDADTRTYVVVINGNRMTLTYQPGRGFIDSNNVLLFQQKH